MTAAKSQEGASERERGEHGCADHEADLLRPVGRHWPPPPGGVSL